jgi:hypothetical protein
MSFDSPNNSPFLFTNLNSSHTPYYQTYDFSTYGTGTIQEGPSEPIEPFCFFECSGDTWYNPATYECHWGNCYSAIGSADLWPRMDFIVSINGTIKIATNQSTLLSTAPLTSQATLFMSSGILINGTITVTIKVDGEEDPTIESSSLSALFTLDPATGNYYTQLDAGTTHKNIGWEFNGYDYDFYTTPVYNFFLNPATGQTWFMLSMNFKISAEDYYSNYKSGQTNVYSILTSVTQTQNTPGICSMYSSNTRITSFPQAKSTSTFNIKFSGAGGSTRNTTTTSYGGAGGGSYIFAEGIPYYIYGNNPMTSIDISIGYPTDPLINGNYAANNTVVTIYYQYNRVSIILSCYGAFNVGDNDNTAGSQGGTFRIVDASPASGARFQGVNGPWGGSNNSNAGNSYSGTTNGYTTSGSCATSTSKSIGSIYAAPPKSIYTLSYETVTSQGAGGPSATNPKPTKTIGFSSGGCSTPYNYDGEGTDDIYRMGKPGVVLLEIVVN